MRDIAAALELVKNDNALLGAFDKLFKYMVEHEWMTQDAYDLWIKNVSTYGKMGD